MLMVFSCACIKTQAQLNLVMNGSFEKKYICPYAVDQIKDAKYWSCIDTAYVSSLDTLYGNPHCSPEYINTCSPTGGAGAPINAEFHHYPRSGYGMADACMYDNRGDTNATNLYYHRDYIMGRLSSMLIAGQSYCVTFYTVMSVYAAYAIDHIGVYLDDGSIDTNSQCGITHTQYAPQVYTNSIITDSLAWTKIQGSFIANGTEKYITIGNFFDTAHTNKIVQNHVNYISMYQIDDVSVIATGTKANAGPDVNINIGQSASIGVPDSNGDGMPCYWYVQGGASPIDSGGRITVSPLVTTNYVVEMDLCGVVTYDTVTVNVAQCPVPYGAAYTRTLTGTHTVNYTYTGSTFEMDSVKWSFGDGTISNALNPVHTYTASGHYEVCVKVYSYCGIDSVCKVDTITLAVGNLSPNTEAAIWPNPVNDRLTVKNATGSELVICDLIGEERVHTILIDDKVTIDVSKLPSGLYVVQIVNQSTGAKVNRKIVVVR